MCPGITRILLTLLIILIYNSNLCNTFLISNYHNTEADSFVLFHEGFDNDKLDGWKIIDYEKSEKSNWYCKDGYLIQDTDVGNKKKLLGSMAIYDKADWTDYVLRASIINTDDDYAGIIFKYKDENNYYRFILSSEQQTITLDKKTNGNLSVVDIINDREWHTCKFFITLFVSKDSIKIFLDEEKIFSVADKNHSPGKVGFVSISNLGLFIDDLILYKEYDIKPSVDNLTISRGPYIQNLLGDSVTIMWRTNFKANSEVEYFTEGGNIIRLKNDTQINLHEVKLKGLLPSTNFNYRVKSEDIVSDWFSFTTPSNVNNEFSFIVYGDTQLNFLEHQKIVEQLKKHQFEFIAHCGDAVQRGPRNDWDTEFFVPLKEILVSKPIYCAIGNHELNSENFYNNFSTPSPNHENYYSFKYSNSFFIFIDNPSAAYPTRDIYTDFRPGSIQYDWLEKQLTSNDAKESDWIFVISHIPSSMLGVSKLFPDGNKYLVPLYEQNKVAINFSGHIHGYYRNRINNVNYIITAGGGGALNKNNSNYLLNIEGFKLVYNFCHLKVNRNQIYFRAFDNNGVLIDETILTKN